MNRDDNNYNMFNDEDHTHRDGDFTSHGMDEFANGLFSFSHNKGDKDLIPPEWHSEDLSGSENGDSLKSRHTPFSAHWLGLENDMDSVGLSDSFLEELDLVDHDDDPEYLCCLEQFINKATKFGKEGWYTEAISICELGLDRFPHQIDLLSLLINFNGKIGAFDKAKTFMKVASDCHHNTLTIEYYSYSIDMLVYEGAHQNEKALRDLLRDMKKDYPLDERCYLAEHDIEEAFGNHQSAVQVLEQAENDHPGASRCMMKLAEHLLEAGDYQHCYSVTLQGIAASAKLQPRVQISYLYLLNCLAEDALLWQKKQHHEKLQKPQIEQLRRKYDTLEREFCLELYPYRKTIHNRMVGLMLLNDE